MQTLEMESAAPLATPLSAPLMVEQTRIIRAPRARVYEAWTRPEIMQQWFGPSNMHCPSATLDVRVGGTYGITVRPTPEAAASPATTADEQRHASATGTYLQVIPNELLQMTWVPNWIEGEESILTISFRDAPGGTEITLRHENFLTEASREGHGKGWSGSLDKLAKNLERG